MTVGPRMRADAATAGLAIAGSMFAAAAGGYALGLLGVPALPVGLVGLFLGLAAGLALVYARFRNL